MELPAFGYLQDLPYLPLAIWYLGSYSYLYLLLQSKAKNIHFQIDAVHLKKSYATCMGCVALWVNLADFQMPHLTAT